ncbi:MAG: hypothetical protein II951_11535 [Bacteroidales bacterium]|nr:hypothetical protein [Bacteroidales bacterium]
MSKISKYMVGALATALVGSVFTSCEDDDIYSVDAPSWLQSEIDRVAAEKAQNGTPVLLSAEDPYQIGITDNYKNAWWTTFSKYYTVGMNDTLTLKFTNYSDCVANYHNWVGMISSDANIKDEANGYTEYLAQRADRWDNVNGSNTVYAGNMVSDLTDDDAWKAWLATMNKAEVTFQVIRKNGKIFTNSTTITSDGKEWTCNLEDGIESSDEVVRVFIVCEESFLQFSYSNKAGELDPLSTVREVDLGDDHAPVAISVSGNPSSIVLGDQNFWKNTVATVTYDNGATIIADSADISFNVVPDLNTVGEKVVVISYSKTKKGGYAQAVATSYKLEVTAPITAIEIEPATSAYYYAHGTTSISEADIDPATFIKQVLGKTGSADILVTDYQTSVSVPSTLGDDIVITVTYKDFTATLNVKVQQMSSSVVSLAGQVVGNAEFTTGFCQAGNFTQGVKVEAGTGAIFNFNHRSPGVQNYENFLVILSRNADPEAATWAEGWYALVRADNAGWGLGTDGTTYDWNWVTTLPWNMQTDWNWNGDPENGVSPMKEAISDAKVSVEVVNKGTKADILCTIVSNVDGKTYHQDYLDITVDGDFYVSFNSEKSYLVFE